MSTTVWSNNVESFVACAEQHMRGPAEADLEEAIEWARRRGQEYMDSAQLAEGEKVARRRLANCNA